MGFGVLSLTNWMEGSSIQCQWIFRSVGKIFAAMLNDAIADYIDTVKSFYLRYGLIYICIFINNTLRHRILADILREAFLFAISWVLLVDLHFEYHHHHHHRHRHCHYHHYRHHHQYCTTTITITITVTTINVIRSQLLPRYPLPLTSLFLSCSFFYWYVYGYDLVYGYGYGYGYGNGFGCSYHLPDSFTYININTFNIYTSIYHFVPQSNFDIAITAYMPEHVCQVGSIWNLYVKEMLGRFMKSYSRDRDRTKWLIFSRCLQRMHLFEWKLIHLVYMYL